MKGVLEIAGALIAVATIALILNDKAQTVPVIKQAGDSFNALLRTVTLQSGMGINR